MNRTSHKLITRVTANPYVAPAGVTPDGIRLAEELEFVRVQDKPLVDGSRPPSLEGHCKVFDKRPTRRYKKIANGEGNGLWNAEYLISLIMDHRGHASSVSPEWRIPRQNEPRGKKRASSEPCSDASISTDIEDIDLDDPDKVPDAWKQLLKLARHPCLAINLYNHYLTSSDEQLAQHHKVTMNRMSNRTNSKAGPNRLEGLNAYQYCGKEGIKPITCPEQYKAIMEWGVDYYKSNLSGYHHWMCFRSTMMHLCHFYGDLPEPFHYSHLPRVYTDPKKEAYNNAVDAFTDRQRRSVDQGKTAFSKEELAEFIERVSRLSDSSDSANTLLFTGLTL